MDGKFQIHIFAATNYYIIMQKLFIFLLLIVVASYNCDSVSAQDNEQVPLHPIATQGQGNSNETGTVHGDLQRSPVYIPAVFLIDNTFLFEGSCIGCQVQILQYEEVIYSSFVDENGIVLLPANLTGECELRLYWGCIVFVGEFEM